MKVVCLLGSPRRNGNSTALARYFLDRTEASCAQTTTFNLNDLPMRGCQGCEGCKGGRALRTVRRPERSPGYCFSRRSGRLRLAGLLQRRERSAENLHRPDLFIPQTPLYPAETPEPPSPARKPLVFILTQGSGDPQAFDDILPRYGRISSTGPALPRCTRCGSIDVYHRGEVEKKRPGSIQSTGPVGGGVDRPPGRTLRGRSADCRSAWREARRHRPRQKDR